MHVPQTSMLRVRVHVVPAGSASTLAFDIAASASRFFVPFITSLVATVLLVSNNAREQRPDAFRRAAVALSIHNVFACLDFCLLRTQFSSQRLARKAIPVLATYLVQAAEIRKMKFLIFFYGFEGEKGES